MQAKSFVFLTDQKPLPPLTGGKIRDAMWIRLLDSIGDLKTIWTDSVANGQHSLHRRLISKFRSYPENGFDPRVVERLKSCHTPGSILVISRLVGGKYIAAAKKIGYRVVLDEHNVESHLLKQLIPSLLHSPYQWYLSQRLERAEMQYCSDADQVFCTSDADRALLSRWIPISKIQVLPNLIDPKDYTNNKKINERAHILFAGTLDYRPNQTGLEWFLKRVLPVILKKSPATAKKILIAGKNPSLELAQAIQKHGVRLWENPADLKEAFSDSQLMFVPLLHGSGTRIKILEAMASGCLVVSTTKGAEGLPFRQKGLWIEDEAAAFANRIIELSENISQYLGESDSATKALGEFCNLGAAKTKLVQQLMA